MKSHPALQEGEKYIGKIKGNLPDHIKNVTGLRLVLPAYNIKGKVMRGYSAVLASADALQSIPLVMKERIASLRSHKKPPTKFYDIPCCVTVYDSAGELVSSQDGGGYANYHNKNPA